MRIISLVPSLSELLCDLSLQKFIVGCTSFCVSPRDLYKTASIVGGTKDPNIEAIKKLHPTHILVNKEENTKEHVRILQTIAPTLITYPKSIYCVPKMIEDIGVFLNIPIATKSLSHKIETKLKSIDNFHKTRKTKQNYCYYFIWKNPWMVAAKNTYIDSLLQLLGFSNMSTSKDRYPQVDLNIIFQNNVDSILLASEPWPFRKRDIKDLAKYWKREPFIYKIDGKLMSWYGTSSYHVLDEIHKFLQQKESSLIHQV